MKIDDILEIAMTLTSNNNINVRLNDQVDTNTQIPPDVNFKSSLQEAAPVQVARKTEGEKSNTGVLTEDLFFQFRISGAQTGYIDVNSDGKPDPADIRINLSGSVGQSTNLKMPNGLELVYSNDRRDAPKKYDEKTNTYSDLNPEDGKYVENILVGLQNKNNGLKVVLGNTETELQFSNEELVPILKHLSKNLPSLMDENSKKFDEKAFTNLIKQKYPNLEDSKIQILYKDLKADISRVSSEGAEEFLRNLGKPKRQI